MENKSRFYDIPGLGSVPSVTTILSVISKPALMGWLSKQGSYKALQVMNKLREMAPYLYDALLGEFGEEFFRDGKSKAAEAADHGTAAHSLIEGILKGGQTRPMEQELPGMMMPGPVRNAVTAFLAWKEKTKFDLVKSESVVYSKSFKYAGTCDAIGRTKYGITLADWKTSSGIYPEYSLQTVAYKYAAEEMSGEKIDQVVIFRFGKDGAFEEYVVPNKDHQELFDRFMDAKRLWTWQQEANKTMSDRRETT